MEHVHQNIVGWFDYSDLYKEMVETANQGAHFVEVGTFVGKSVAYLIVESVNSGKDIKIDVVDNFSHKIDDKWPWSGPKIQYKCYKYNMERLNLMSHINKTYYMDSIEAAKTYQNRSLDFVFIDAGHDFSSVFDDIKSWLPKIKLGGYLCGHDYSEEHFPGVYKAVDLLLGSDKIEVKGDGEYKSWMFQVKGKLILSK